MLRSTAGPAQDGADARGQFAGGAGLGDVVVGAQFQADDAVGVVAPCREHEHRHGTVLAQFGEHFDAVQARHHDVQDGDRVGAPQGQGQAILAVVGHGHLKPLAGQIVGQHADQFGIVVDQQHLGHWK